MITSVTVRVRRVPGGEGLRGLALAVLRRRRRRDAHARAGRAAADGAAALRRDRDRDQPGRPRGGRRRVGRRLPDDRRLRGHAGGGRPPVGRRCTALLTALGGDLARRGARSGVGAGPLRRAVPARLDARRRRAGRDPRDRDVLVPPARGVRRGVGRAARRRSATRRSCCATSPTSTRPAPRSTSPWPPPRATTRSGGGSRPRRPRWTRSSRPAPRSPTTTRSAPTTSRGSRPRSGRSGSPVLRAVKAAVDPDGDPQPRRAGALSGAAGLRRWKRPDEQLRRHRGGDRAGRDRRCPRRSAAMISNASPAASGSARLDREQRPGHHEDVDQRLVGQRRGPRRPASPAIESVAPGTSSVSPDGPATGTSPSTAQVGRGGLACGARRRARPGVATSGRSGWRRRRRPRCGSMPLPACVTASSPGAERRRTGLVGVDAGPRRPPT